MELNNDEGLSLENKHKKERKELQAKIQGLKKSAKNDKSKKKEVSAEIARLEADLETRHKNEIENIQEINLKETDIVEPDVIVNNTVNKVSKAQKRRDKKLLEDRDREERIKLQEKENEHGPRNTELQCINSKLKERNLSIYKIASDGDCLYKAISHQLKTVRDIALDVEELRQKAAQYMRINKDEFMPFLSHPDTFDMLTDIEFDDYCDKITNTKVWGGQLEVRALSNCLKCPITIIQATGPDAIEQGLEFDGPPLIIAYHRHMYSLGEHYNSTQAVIQDEPK
ncbi:deubiquitinase OTUD6B [Leptidea sinapis]|uniref:deubiquitinase OTUD6B n=1 Tax=Leptidea sinapis TaxID=189913 RepID=UPI0021C2CD1C|nr:deubiquitinase OTUD6B [Leptidea sinapis]